MEQNQLNQMVQRFPTPRLQIDDGNQEMAEMHAREDLLLNYYSWVDRAGGKVRIPIARAMQIIAQNGLPVAPEEQTEPLMAGDRAPVVTVPLTDGFARTGYEQQYMETLEQQRMRGEKPGEQAALGANR
jgi:FtsP/CotA-like multicopper oxidase with cupredoxin domain